MPPWNLPTVLTLTWCWLWYPAQMTWSTPVVIGQNYELVFSIRKLRKQNNTVHVSGLIASELPKSGRVTSNQLTCTCKRGTLEPADSTDTYMHGAGCGTQHKLHGVYTCSHWTELRAGVFHSQTMKAEKRSPRLWPHSLGAAEGWKSHKQPADLHL